MNKGVERLETIHLEGDQSQQHVVWNNGVEFKGSQQSELCRQLVPKGHAHKVYVNYTSSKGQELVGYETSDVTVAETPVEKSRVVVEIPDAFIGAATVLEMLLFASQTGEAKLIKAWQFSLLLLVN